MVAINLMGPIHVIETWSPLMVAAGRGGHRSGPRRPGYACMRPIALASTGCGTALRFDLARHGIGVSVVVPGAVKFRWSIRSRSSVWIG